MQPIYKIAEWKFSRIMQWIITSKVWFKKTVTKVISKNLLVEMASWGSSFFSWKCPITAFSHNPTLERRVVSCTQLHPVLKAALPLWQNGLWSFQTGDAKLERFLLKNQHTQRKIFNFENWISGGLRSFQKS